jgi:hypothetical protein
MEFTVETARPCARATAFLFSYDYAVEPSPLPFDLTVGLRTANRNLDRRRIEIVAGIVDLRTI